MRTVQPRWAKAAPSVRPAKPAPAISTCLALISSPTAWREPDIVFRTTREPDRSRAQFARRASRSVGREKRVASSSLLTDPLPTRVFESRLIGDNRQDQHDSEHHLLQVAVNAHQIHAVRQQSDEDCAQDHVAGAANAAEQ